MNLIYIHLHSECILLNISCFFLLLESEVTDCSVGEYYADYYNECRPCYYYCSPCSDGFCRECAEECGCDQNCTSRHQDCDISACGGCLPGFTYHTYGHCVCENTNHCCEDNCLVCGGPGDCQECIPGKYGYLCSEDCPSNCTKCNATGECTECTPGMYGQQCSEVCRTECTECLSYDKCTGCVPGYFGPNCSETCRSTCTSCIDYDTCTECKPGKYGTSCEYTCRPECETCTGYDNCTKCSGSRYGDACDMLCGGACSRCTDYDTCTECIPGKHGYWCNYDCPEGCKDNLCTRSGQCLLPGCEVGYYYDTLYNRCKKCHYYCVECWSYGNCSECLPGYYDLLPTYSCQAICTHCKNGLCDRTTGACTEGCEDPEKFYPKSKGGCERCPEYCVKCASVSNCSECIPGKHGQACEESCNFCHICDKATGYCTSGCEDGHFLDATTNTCFHCPYSCTTCTNYDNCNGCKFTDVWGPNCLYDCHFCNGSCDKDTGCTTECVDGYYKYFDDAKGGFDCYRCSNFCMSCTGGSYGECLACEDSHWGVNCDNSCEACLNDICDRYRGCIGRCKDHHYSIMNGNVINCETCPEGCENCFSNVTCSGCKAGFYGVTCEQRCSGVHEGCLVCTGDSIVNFDCTECVENYYPGGRNVCQPCPVNCRVGSWPYCSPMTGHCNNGCARSLFWGQHCQNNCSGCKNNLCDSLSGCVDGCLDGYYLTSTDHESHCDLCPHNCVSCFDTGHCDSCKSGFHGNYCQYSCKSRDSSCNECTGNTTEDFICTVCEEGNYPGLNSCLPCNTQCLHGMFPYCMPTTGHCKYGCQNGWYGDMCDKAECLVDDCEACRPGNPYSCLLCGTGYFLFNEASCKACPRRCSSACDSVSGVCDAGCEGGWAGDQCDQNCHSRCLQCHQGDPDVCEKCRMWFYGETCESSCSINCREGRDSEICDTHTGYCIHGCTTGHWGRTCVSTCSDGCIDELCDPASGACLNGCKDGTWGSRCEETCSEGCIESACDGATGDCRIGCRAGFIQDKCVPGKIK